MEKKDYIKKHIDENISSILENIDNSDMIINKILKTEIHDDNDLKELEAIKNLLIATKNSNNKALTTKLIEYYDLRILLELLHSYTYEHTTHITEYYIHYILGLD